MSDSTLNAAGMHKTEIIAAIEVATRAELQALDYQLHQQGWDENGQCRVRIRERLAALGG